MWDTNVSRDVIFYHGAFVHYITPEESTAQPQDQTRRSASLRKLAGFSDKHLIELSADMYDELQRRKSPELLSAGPLEPRKDIHWKRNDARKHVGSLPDRRFRDICRDLVTEQERRYAELKTGPTYPLQDAMPMSELKARRSQKSMAEQSVSTEQGSGYTLSIPSRSSNASQDEAPGPLHIATDQVIIQSVNESNVTPTKVRIIESESDSEDEGSAYGGDSAADFRVQAPAAPATPGSKPVVARSGGVINDGGSSKLDPSHVRDESQSACSSIPSRLSDTSSCTDTTRSAVSTNPDYEMATAAAPLPLQRPHTPAEDSFSEDMNGSDTEVESPRRADQSQNQSYDLSTNSNDRYFADEDASGKSIKSMDYDDAGDEQAGPSSPEMRVRPLDPSSGRRARGAESSSHSSNARQSAPPPAAEEQAKAVSYTNSLPSPIKDTEEENTAATNGRTESDDIDVQPASEAEDAINKRDIQPETPLKGLNVKNPEYPISPPDTAEKLRSAEPSAFSGASSASSAAPAADASSKDKEEAEKELENLRKMLREQQEVTNQVRSEAARFLQEMRALTRQHEEQINRAESLDTEARHWKARYSKASTELESAKQLRIDTAISQVEFDGLLPEAMSSADGKMSEVKLKSLMSAISVLASAVHSDERSDALLTLLHRVVLAAREISQGSKLALRAVKQLISVVRNFTVSSGLFPRILVDAACSDLAMAVIEHAREVKVIPDSETRGRTTSRQPRNPAVHKGVLFSTSPARLAGSRPTSQKLPSSPAATMQQNAEAPVPTAASSAASGAAYTAAGQLEEAVQQPQQAQPPKKEPPNDTNDSSGTGPAAASAATVNREVRRSAETEPSDAKTETAKTETAKTETAKTETVKTETAKTETVKTETGAKASPKSPQSASEPDSQGALSRAQSNCTSVSTRSQSSVSSSKSVSGSDHSRSTSYLSDGRDSASSSVRARRMPLQGPEMPLDESIQSLQTYLEEQTSGTVEAIGALLSGIKSNAVAGELKPLMAQIKTLVGDMIEATNKTMAETRSVVLKNKGAYIVQNLGHCLDRMDMLCAEEIETIRDDARPNRHLKQRLAGVNFDMAKSTKELVKTVEEIVLQDELNHIDRRLV